MIMDEVIMVLMMVLMRETPVPFVFIYYVPGASWTIP